MTGIRFACAAGLIVIVAGVANAADPTPQEILAAKGLVQDGKYFLLVKPENEVKQQLNKVLPLVDDLDVLFNQWAENEQKKYMVAAMNDELTGTQAAINNNRAMYSQLDRNAYIAKSQRQDLDQLGAMLRQYYNQVQNNRDAMRNSIAGPVIQQKHLDKVAKAREVFLKAYDEMTPSVDRLKAAYAEVAQDDKVANALKVLRQSKSVQMKLGPSEPLLRAMARVNHAKNVTDPQFFKPTPYNTKQKLGKVTTKTKK
jgi:hypothetical protein